MGEDRLFTTPEGIDFRDKAVERAQGAPEPGVLKGDVCEKQPREKRRGSGLRRPYRLFGGIKTEGSRNGADDIAPAALVVGAEDRQRKAKLGTPFLDDPEGLFPALPDRLVHPGLIRPSADIEAAGVGDHLQGVVHDDPVINPGDPGGHGAGDEFQPPLVEKIRAAGDNVGNHDEDAPGVVRHIIPEVIADSNGHGGAI